MKNVTPAAGLDEKPTIHTELVGQINDEPLPEVPAHMYCRCSTKLPLQLKKETKMIDLTIGSTVIVDGGRDRWSDSDHLVGVPVQVMAIFDGLGLDDGKSIQMVAVSNKGGSSCCFRADMCKPAKTDEEKAVGAMLVEMSTKMQLRGDHDDYMVNDDTQVGVEFVIEYMAANGFKWVGE